MFEIYRSTLATRGGRVVPLTIGLGLVALIGFIATQVPSGRPPADLLSIVYTLVVMSGIVGMDVLNGSAHLLLSRAITRNAYLAGRFLGGLTVASVVCLAMYASAAVAAVARGDQVDAIRFLAAQALSALASVIWTASVVLFFSTLLPERGDVLGYLGLVVFALSIGGLAQLTHHAVLVAVARFVRENFYNALVLSDIASHPALLTDVLRWASNTLLVLTAATLVFHRRELSYASG